MFLYRVLRKAYVKDPFDGEGAFRFGGRWSSPGVRLSYTSEHQSLAMLEYFVHLDSGDPPPDLVLAVAEMPPSLASHRVPVSDLPVNWRETPAPPSLATFGDEFAKRSESVALVVPSALAPSEFNWLLNPTHPDFPRIVIRDVEPLGYDQRMFKSRARKHT